MADAASATLRAALRQKIAESVEIPERPVVRRRVFGRTRFPGKSIAVVGMRRAGKTTFVHQLRKERLREGLPARNLPYVNFEDERLAGLSAPLLGLLETEFDRTFPLARDAGPLVWHFDEIQNVPGWERFVRRLLDSPRTDVVVTGSSAALLSREVATSLRGRGWEVPIYPFSFEEALRHRGLQPPDDPSTLSRLERGRLERAFLDWLSTGGFPEAQGLDAGSRKQLLRNFVDVAMLRDVIERHDVRTPGALRWLVRQLLGSPAALFSVDKWHRTARSQGLSVAKNTVHDLLAHLVDCFLIRVVWMESASERQRMTNPRKAYPVDPGLIPIFERSGHPNRGRALETAVLVELERRRAEVTYVRTATHREVDFLAVGPDGTAELVQVSAEAADPATEERELRALEEAGAMFPHARKRLLTLTHDGLPPNAPPDVVAQPAYEWMLGPGEAA